MQERTQRSVVPSGTKRTRQQGNPVLLATRVRVAAMDFADDMDDE